MAAKGRMTWQRYGFESPEAYAAWARRQFEVLDRAGWRKTAKRLEQQEHIKVRLVP